jgi:hypothetical protein
MGLHYQLLKRESAEAHVEVVSGPKRIFVNGDTGGNVEVNRGSEDESAGVYSELVSRSILFEIYD